ncbi:DUF4252 domain-containing protein [candidate division KSB1 bacterium]|nr:DUF4252 domain-containing protein [candidate division KSB1 bacterium]
MKRIIILLCFVPLLVFGQETDFSKMAGYIDLDELTKLFNSEAVTEVEIQNPLLSMAADMMEEEDPKVSSMLKTLQLIKVYTFENTVDQIKDIKAYIEELDGKLSSRKWNRFVKVRDENETTYVYLKNDGKKVKGLTVLSVDNDESTFVNIVGDIDLKNISSLGGQFNIPKMDSIQTR